MNTNVFAVAEKRNKKKSLTTAILIHIVLFGLALIPFAVNQELPEEMVNSIVLVDFTPEAPSSSSASKGAPEDPKPQAPPATTPEEPKEEIKTKPEPKPTPAPKPVLTTPDKKAPTPPKSREKIIPQKEKPTPKLTPAPPAKEPVKVDSAPKKKPTTSTGKATTTETKPAGSGGANVGKSDKGKSDTGMDAGIFEGDGLLSRRVVHRADVKSLTREEGKIVINICVNREGRVTYAQYNKKDSSIKTNKLVRDAERTARNYKFERDYTVSDKQCGKLTFIFEL